MVGGVNVPVYGLGGTACGGDISAFAGAVAEVEIVSVRPIQHQETIVDNIRFSALPVPDPGVGSMVATGVALPVAKRRETRV